MITPPDIAVERCGEAIVARIGGEVDMTNADAVRDELVLAVPNDAALLVVDLGGCRYLDSAGIELLFDLARRLQRRRQGIRLAVPAGSPLRRVLELTDVGSIAPVHESLDAALAE